jgi:uncharacterized paraquat-inducible protein A
MVFVKVIGCFLVLVPAVLYGITLLGNEKEITKTILFIMIKVSLVVGVVVFVCFLVLIVVEQIQDYYFDAQYQKQRNQKVLLANGHYECQYCGNQRVRENDKTCHVCGKELSR